MGGLTNSEDDRENLPSAFLALLWLLPPPRLSRRRRRRAAQEKISGDQVSISPQLRWTLLALQDLLWGQNLPRLSRLVLAARRLSSQSRLERLRGGEGGQIGNLKKCPTVDQIKEKMGEGMEGDWCVLYQLGWIDETGKENNETSTADLMSLKPEVLAELDESAMATCAQERVAMIGKMMEKKHKRCANKFSEEDKAELTEMALKIQGYNCFKEMFHSACQNRQEPSLRFLPGTSNGGGFHRGFNNRCSSHDYCLVLSNLMQKTKFTPSSLCSFQYFIIYAFRRTSRFFKTIFFSGSLK